MLDFVAGGEEWPPAAVAERFLGREWVKAELGHAPGAGGRNFYAKLLIEPTDPEEFADPQVWHFAYTAT